ncbi:hypothetical protein [Fimbriiglobus ruber]|uniref:hypothetical protein n=1 Tax=Fimbriiglobus ruber TaxID=1908690 RepID=UPI000B4AB27B|nr:hypothetical protein [Fimbriiglobus ruber]
MTERLPITNSSQVTPLSPDQITASRDRLVSEGFHPSSKAVRVHDQLLELFATQEVNTEGAVASIGDLQDECERLQGQVERLKRAAVTAVVPLEVLKLSSSVKLLCPGLREAVAEGIQAVREVITESEDK